MSNHGGRQLDSASATIEALPAVVQALGGRVPVLVDGGIRRGTDLLNALARISQCAVKSHGSPVGETKQTHPGTIRSARNRLEG